MGDELVVLGGGESGTGAALLAKAKGIKVFLSDCGTIKSGYCDELKKAGVEFESGKHSEKRILNALEVVKSPGIPEHAPLIKKIRQKGIPIISEIEFAGRFSKAKMIGITGSNGKTTTATWTYHMIKKGGKDVRLAGNIGTSLARHLISSDPELFVLELSSFQLEDMYDFKCDVAVITNLSPDHLDRYDYRFEKYVDAKFRILNNHDKQSVFIYNAHDQEIMKRMGDMQYPGIRYPFALSDVYGQGACVEYEQMVIKTLENRVTFPLNQLALSGKHNICNGMAASLAALSVDTPIQAVIEGLKDFDGVEHRLESVDEVNGVLYINDSKATNVDSVWYALESMDKPVVWIAGGTDKGNDYTLLEDLAGQKVKTLICLGVDNRKLISAFTGKIPEIVETRSMADAVSVAQKQSKPGDVVLLSPACASFDLFKNYEHRGKLFKEEVYKLKNQYE
ncbi:UDP-N-acetylmuramoyl-L-alanine--D-glutamate ligase [Thermophagus xiamenensis]|uniref:UDP-N-acetylmuramoylalanine--D-glutamate ligase n=1 Tax=Thermophagus xiamenensis TaxID=385682 RepID=A0A1I1YLD4_9BACT|nr:UDP-N-acetylmuramoyl-L-alanine--D-glutamate ligase [Thermophagus xiamenensis]SFE20102.1 UDP-N-acetylmuramoylalanine--D-glutamate ligase [Thermophagus xiamenensis]